MSAYQNELTKFAIFYKYEDAIRYLAEDLADKEEWSFSGSSKNFAILKNYLEHTFRKINQDKKFVYTADNNYSSFNTGLVTSNLEEIYALFEKNKRPSNVNSIPWCFKAFLKKSDNQILKYFSQNFPERADYFERPDLLIFNPKCDLIPDVEHIIDDNKDRFPTHLQKSDPAEIQRHLDGAIDEVKKKVRTNYKIAIPQYYGGRIQLLLPLCLTTGSPNPDLALAVHSLNDKTYTSRTCLTLRMAYNNARLIVKPQSEWLKP
jgi:isocitrate dehydrogenase kinase/phosphatase